MAKYDDLDTKQIFTIGIASVLVTVVTILAVQYVYHLLVQGHQVQLQADSSYQRQNNILVEQSDSVSQYGVDPANGNVTIPIEKAMELVVKENQSDSKEENDVPAEQDET
ncbi:hypothetical protein FYK55_00570 [Roseiconus nitratireducens]|uniref:Uncharacterized protein n=1 Tax=Roseiconus nitratireducens TaxID=2605748 RepID=A0A5M6DHE9_9BACT|nr:hypothetical protein [Roseiconus nitratireducens]KAA5546951.1 hypothetical protein FYK55_00570 [Roseiconus nitratireducens]